MQLSELLGLTVGVAEERLGSMGIGFETVCYEVKKLPLSDSLRVVRALYKGDKVELTVSPFLTDLRSVIEKDD